MSEWELRDPLFLLCALFAPVVYWLAARMPAVVTYSTLTVVAGAPRSWRVRLARLPALLLALATVALAVGMAGPRSGDATTRVQREGIAIAMVVDRSESMRALDLSVGDQRRTRLDVVKEVFRDFVTGGGDRLGRVDDLIGLVAFGTWAETRCPLTLDHPNLLAILEDLDTGRRVDGRTALGEGLALAVERLREHEAKSKVAILLTDGTSNAGEITPGQAAELAAKHGIKVYTIGAGTDGVAHIAMKDRHGREQLVRQRFPLDERTLIAIAEKTGGRFFRATDATALAATVEEIDRLERSEIVELRYLRYTEHYGILAITALALVASAGLASRTFFRRLP